MEFCIRLLVYIIIVYMNEYDWIALADDCLRIHRRKTQSHNTNKMLDLSSLWPKTIANGISGIGAYIECECKSTGLCEDDAILFLTIHMFECKPKTQWILYSNVYNNDVVTHLFYAFVLLLKHILYNKRCAISWVWSLLFWCRNINHQYSLVVLCIHIHNRNVYYFGDGRLNLFISAMQRRLTLHQISWPMLFFPRIVSADFCFPPIGNETANVYCRLCIWHRATEDFYMHIIYRW